MLPCFVVAAIQLGAGKKPVNFYPDDDDKDSLLAVQFQSSKASFHAPPSQTESRQFGGGHLVFMRTDEVTLGRSRKVWMSLKFLESILSKTTMWGC